MNFRIQLERVSLFTSGGGRITFIELVHKIRWPIVAVIGVFYIFWEVIEHPTLFWKFDLIFVSELLLVEGLLVVIGVVIGQLLNSIKEQTITVNILETKNNLSQQLATAQGWEEMTAIMAEFPSTIMPLEGSSLLVYSPSVEQFELSAHWVSIGIKDFPNSLTHQSSFCTQCILDQSFVLRHIDDRCFTNQSVSRITSDYCLPLSYGENLRAMLHLRVSPNFQPTSEQTKVINNIGPEMAIALRAAKENRIREHMAAEQAANSVRRDITRDMHDILAQNLCYINMKLDQIVEEEENPEACHLRPELQHLRDVTDESFELVRGTLSALHPNNSTKLGSILSQHAYSITKRSHLEIEFTEEGVSQGLEPLMMQHIYYLFREALSNIEKHAGAELIKINLVWREGDFCLNISDDGKGFDPQLVDFRNHLGLANMNERVIEFGGEFSIHSIIGKGTNLRVTIPLSKESTKIALLSQE